MKLYYSHFGNNPSKNVNHIETSQLICFENQLTGFFTAKASTERYLQTDVNGICQICQGIKKKKKLNQSRIRISLPPTPPPSPPPKKKSHTVSFPKNSKRRKPAN